GSNGIDSFQGCFCNPARGVFHEELLELMINHNFCCGIEGNCPCVRRIDIRVVISLFQIFNVVNSHLSMTIHNPQGEVVEHINAKTLEKIVAYADVISDLTSGQIGRFLRNLSRYRVELFTQKLIDPGIVLGLRKIEIKSNIKYDFSIYR